MKLQIKTDELHINQSGSKTLSDLVYRSQSQERGQTGVNLKPKVSKSIIRKGKKMRLIEEASQESAKAREAAAKENANNYSTNQDTLDGNV